MKIIISDSLSGLAVTSDILEDVSQFVTETFCEAFGLMDHKLTIIFDETKKPTKCGSISVFGMPGQIPAELIIRVFIHNPHFRKKTVVRVTDTLLHELIHFLQYELGLLGISHRGATWKGVDFKTPTNYFQYRMLPWEREAFKLSVLMTNEMKLELYKQFELPELLNVSFVERVFGVLMKGK